jgi:HPt (histidine-containing phosphotransfer) domain-containing protein
MPELTRAQRVQLAALRADYEAGLAAAVARVIASAVALGAHGCDRAGLRVLRELAHRLVGSSALWGFSRVSAAAARLEDLTLRASAGSPLPAGEFARQSKRLTRLLGRAVPMPRDPKPALKRGGVSLRRRARRGSA